MPSYSSMLSQPDNDTSPKVTLIILSVAATLLLSSLSQTIVTTALPTILTSLGGSEYLTWVVVAYLLTASIVAPIYGKLGDLFGRKRLLQIAMLIFVASSTLAALATSIEVLVFARALQGLGGGGLMVIAMTVVADTIPIRQRARVQGLLSIVFGVATVAGPLLGGLLVDLFGWQSIFVLNIPLGLLTLATISFALKKDNRRNEASIDYPGFVLLASTLGLFILATSLGDRVFPWASPQMFALIFATIVSLALFIFAENLAREPILPLKLFKVNTFIIVNSMGLITGMAMFGCSTFVPLFLQTVKNESATGSGIQLIPMMAGLVISSTVSGHLMSWSGKYKMIALAGAVLLSTGLFLLFSLDVQTPVWMIMVSLLIVGMGLGPINSVGVTALQNAIDRSMVGIATASSMMFRQVGGSLGVSVLGVIFASSLTANLPKGAEQVATNYSALNFLPDALRELSLQAFIGSMHSVFLAAAISSIIAILLACVLHELPLINSKSQTKESS